MLLELLGNFFVAAYFSIFVMRSAAVVELSNLPLVLLIAKQILDCCFTIVRRFPQKVTVRPEDWVVGIAGTIFPVLFRAQVGGNWAPLIICIMLSGLLLQIAALLSLGRSTGIVPANRGVKTTGMYHFVRHPLYASYCCLYFGFLLSMFSWWNGFVFTSIVVLLVMRIRAEERLLSDDPQFRQYCREIPWKLVPGIL